MSRKLFAGVLTGLLITGFALLGGGVANAHSAAIGSSPENGAQIELSPRGRASPSTRICRRATRP